MKETTMMTTMSGMMDAEQRMTSLTPKVSFALVTLSRRPSVFTSPRSSAMRLAHAW